MVIECISVYYYNNISSLVTFKDLNLLCFKLHELHSEWELFGTHLQLPYATIQEIKTKPNSISAKDKMIKVLDKWKQQGNNTWRRIYDAVLRLQDIALAEDIKQHHPLDSEG